MVVLQVSRSLTHHTYKVNQLQCYEADAAQLIGINLWQLMQRAGAAVFQQIKEKFPDARKLIIICGKGNNGGDGYIIAALAHQAGLSVRSERRSSFYPKFTRSRAQAFMPSFGDQDRLGNLKSTVI